VIHAQVVSPKRRRREAGELNDIRAVLGNDIAIKAYRRESFRFRRAQSLAE
jgi:hypothetical protein